MVPRLDSHLLLQPMEQVGTRAHPSLSDLCLRAEGQGQHYCPHLINSIAGQVLDWGSWDGHANHRQLGKACGGKTSSTQHPVGSGLPFAVSGSFHGEMTSRDLKEEE